MAASDLPQSPTSDTQMNPNQARELITELTEKINRYNDEYYQKGESSIDDNTFDLLLEQLTTLEEQFPEFRTEDSPSQRVGGKPIEDFESIPHTHPMLSLSNLYNRLDLDNWLNTVTSRLPDTALQFGCEVKIDGIAISLVYNEGILTRAITRGNGEIGDDVTANVRTIRNLPLKLDRPLNLELRGEVFLPKSRFEQINQRRSREGQPIFKNPRNAAAGTIRTKDTRLVAQRGLDILLYDIVVGQVSQYHSENLDFMGSLSLPVNSYRKNCSSSDEIFNFCMNWENRKSDLPFEIDGVVLKVDNLDHRTVLGVTAKSPRWAMAWKFKAEKAASRLVSIEDSIGRTGILTPVANLKPVLLMGTEVKRATLHNYDQISRLGIHEGDTLFVEKGGDIIPKIVGIDFTCRIEDSKPILPPENCPVCGSRLYRFPEEVDLHCDNISCPAIIEGRLEHFISKKAMDIQSFGKAQIKQFIQKGLVRSIPDIYTLYEHRETLITMEGMGSKSVNNLLNAIDSSKKKPLNHLIHALGIRHIGEKAAKTLALKTGSIQQFLDLKEKDLETVSDFGPIMLSSVISWIQQEENRSMLKQLIALGLSPEPITVSSNQPFAGLKIVITGKLSQPRDLWKNRLEALGFQVASSVSNKTGYLLAGEDAGSKLARAKKLDIPIMSEDEMEALLNKEGK